jgi:uncharacterized protein
MKIMATLYKQGKDPSEIMPILKGENNKLKEIFPDIGRNDPCLCGSGIKFKKCHGKNF